MENVDFQRAETVSEPSVDYVARIFQLRRATANNRRIDGCGVLRKPWKIFREANRSRESKHESILRPSRERRIARSRVTDKADDVAFLPHAERSIDSDQFCTRRRIEFAVNFNTEEN